MISSVSCSVGHGSSEGVVELAHVRMTFLRKIFHHFQKNNEFDKVEESHNDMVESTSETIGNYNDQEGESRNSEAVEIKLNLKNGEFW